MNRIKISALSLVLIILNSIFSFAQRKPILLKNVTLVDGSGTASRQGLDILIKNDRIAQIGNGISGNAFTTINLSGKTVMPSLISAHTHVGTLKGNTSNAENYTRGNVLRQLKQYQDYGINSVLVMGTDRPMLFETGLRDSTVAGLLPGARLFSAGYGFNTPDPSPGSWMNLLFRPETADEVPAMIEMLALNKPTVVKMWVDDHGAKSGKMKPEIYQAIIREAHKRNIRVAAHLFYVDDALALTQAGLDVMAHSIRDREVTDELLKEMKAKNVIYIPTLSLDHYAYIYADNPAWIQDDFFKSSLEPGVWEMITDKTYQDKIRNAPEYTKNKEAAKVAMINLKKIADAGITVALGTDSGAFPIRPQGFSEHYDLELMVQSGISPVKAIRAGTANAAKALGIDADFGTIVVGKKADFVILEANPESNIKNTRKIHSVWKDGKEVSKGILNTSKK
ncbi:amidohydrolase family protein [Dyadobacter psychrotolerans]|uniref:Amidohydrolase n=1 Tax=Dyadobacter psychrotolerans TaxID=2541721 RepID=A0A4V2Z4S9_9BACT|nr:amidohydrolase family protein [Dyadobacter psychrotolerans]TDE17468.1 amidohydrolase [Dyadobacter psychrotolerans]